MTENIVDFSVKGKVVLVTGGAAGIGAALVRRLLFENAQVVVFLDVSENEGWALERELREKYGALRSKFIKCDVSDEESFSTTFQHIIEKYRRLDIIINDAAILSTDSQDFKKMIDVNFTAAVSSTLKGLSTMDVGSGGSGGCVVNISSLLALTGTCQFPVYTATKAAVLQFSRAIGVSEKYSETKVRVLTVCLGPTDTAILQRQNSSNFHKDSQGLASRVPVRQRVESAAVGIIEVIKRGASGSVWKVAEDQPAEEITDIVGRYNGKS